MWARVQQVLGVVRRICGMPDYAAYMEHVQRCHPGQPILDVREFYAEYLRARYEAGATRCC